MKIKNYVFITIFSFAFTQLGGTAICHCGEENSTGGTYLYVVGGSDCRDDAYGGAVNFVWEEQYPGVWGSTPSNQNHITGTQAMNTCCD